MTGIIDRIAALAGTEWEQATKFAHSKYQEELAEHRHTGRAILETVAAVCREYNNLAGLAAGFSVERWLQYEKDKHDAAKAEAAPVVDAGWTLVPHEGDAAAPPPKAAIAKPPPRRFDLDLPIFHQKPGKVALQVFGALLLLKMAAAGARWFHREKKQDVWFAPAARIRLFSGALAAYFVVAALKSPTLSAWRNGAAFFFGTDAIKPLLRPPPRRKRRRA
jgi:hypothetical protein